MIIRILIYNLTFLYSGKKSNNPDSPDYVPSIFAYKSHDKKNKLQKTERFDRLMKRRKSTPNSNHDDIENEENLITSNNEEGMIIIITLFLYCIVSPSFYCQFGQ